MGITTDVVTVCRRRRARPLRQPEEFLVPLATSSDTLILVVAGATAGIRRGSPPGRRRNG